MMDWQWLPANVTPDFLELVNRTYPVLDRHSEEAALFRRIMEYCLFGHPVKDAETGKRELRFPHELIYEWKGSNSKRAGDGARAWLERFSEEVVPVEVSPYVRPGLPGRSPRTRVIAPLIPPHIREAAADEASSFAKDTAKRVNFVLQETVSTRGLAEQISRYRASLVERATVPVSHPATVLHDFLRQQPTRTSQRIVRRNLPAVLNANSHPSNQIEHAWQAYGVPQILRGVSQVPELYYSASPKTPRLHAVGTNLHLLPRATRKQLLNSTTSMDLAAAQLGVISRLWGINELYALLENDGSFWRHLTDGLGIPEDAKAWLKPATYGLCYGAGEERIMREVQDHHPGSPEDQSRDFASFMAHPLIHQIREARSRTQQRVRERGGVEDAFGRWLPLRDSTLVGRESTDKAVRSLMAQEAQSYELRIMLAALPVIVAERDVRIISWLHDGLAISIGDPRERRRKLTRIEDEVNREARALDIPTKLVTET